MSIYLKIVLILFGLAYLISPVDIIPDLLIPFAGWIDDGFVLWTIFHLIRYGEVPWFFFKKKPLQGPVNPFKSPKNHRAKANPLSGRGSKKKKKESVNSNGCDSIKSARKILGISADATWKEIQAAHKEKIKQYHPDKLSHLGEEFSQLANKKFLEIQKAYETLKKTIL
jgi:hypothetical protein